MTLRVLLLRYACFAGLAILVNLAVQRMVLMTGTTNVYFALAMVAGTGAGLFLKYLLDKRWIFHDTSTGMRAHGRLFSVYAALGLITTAVFWGTETLFWMIWKTTEMRELGAVLGLIFGYVAKYRLDRRFVFASSHQPAVV